MLNAELDDHLDNEAAEGSRNRRDGSSKKTVLTEAAKIDIRIPRDREGTFDPKLIQRYQRRFPGFDDKIVSMYARGALELPDGRQRVVRRGHDPARPIQTGIGPVEVSKPKARDRGATRADERIRYSSSILPKWARRTKSLDILLPALYLRGVSTGDFQDVLTALLDKDAPNLSPSVIGRLKSDWEDDDRRWQASDLSARRYVYVWADGVYLQARMEPQAECILVLIGATPEGKEELLGLQTGMRESGQSWEELLVDLKARGLSIAPDIAVGACLASRILARRFCLSAIQPGISSPRRLAPWSLSSCASAACAASSQRSTSARSSVSRVFMRS